MKYYANYTINDKNEIVLTTREFPCPKNVINADLFDTALKASLEKRFLSRLCDMRNKAEKDGDTSKLNEINAVIDKLCKECADIPKELTDDDKTFIKYMTIVVAGTSKAQAWENTDGIISAIAPCLRKVIDAKSPSSEELKAFKQALNDFCYNRLGTTNKSGLFKNFHIEFNNNSAMHIVTKAEPDVKACADGLIMKALSENKSLLNKVCVEILRIGAMQDLKFNPSTIIEKI